jgi:hypothetical protein
MSEILNKKNLDNLFDEQLSSWEQAGSNYRALESVLVKEIKIEGYPFKIQFNPARITSSAAKVDVKSISERKCFLCRENRPAVQRGLSFINEQDTSDPYTVLINPFPIFPRHLTIPLLSHTDQLIAGRFDAMLNLAKELPEYTLFYNGPRCGASAPDHFHFQAGNRGFLTIERELKQMKREVLFKDATSEVYLPQYLINGVIALETTSVKGGAALLERIFATLPVKEGEQEPMVNILCWFEPQEPEGKADHFTTLIFVRGKHRPSHYFAEGDNNILLSPASVDLGGVLITPLEKDFVKIGEWEISEIFEEICIGREEFPVIADKIKKALL